MYCHGTRDLLQVEYELVASLVYKPSEHLLNPSGVGVLPIITNSKCFRFALRRLLSRLLQSHFFKVAVAYLRLLWFSSHSDKKLRHRAAQGSVQGTKDCEQQV